MPTTGSRPIPIADPSRTCTYRGQYMITATPARQTAPPNRYGMISDNLVRKLLDWIKEGRRTPAAGDKVPGALLHLRCLQYPASGKTLREGSHGHPVSPHFHASRPPNQFFLWAGAAPAAGPSW